MSLKLAVPCFGHVRSGHLYRSQPLLLKSLDLADAKMDKLESFDDKPFSVLCALESTRSTPQVHSESSRSNDFRVGHRPWGRVLGMLPKSVPPRNAPRHARSGARRWMTNAIDHHASTPLLLPSVPNPVKPNELKADSISSAYQWQPIQVRHHSQNDHQSYFVGTYVSTLSMDVRKETFPAPSRLIRPISENFVSQESLWCHLFGESFVLCRGVVSGTIPASDHEEVDKKSLVARLPVGLRPGQPLQFAALSRKAFNVGGHVTYSSQLVTLAVFPDGWIKGLSSREVDGAIDLSAIRFCTSRGISLIDEVRLHTCEVRGTRMVCLQGDLSDRFFTTQSHKPLALLPESCRPPGNLPFIVAGMSPGCFHLVVARPSYGLGCGGDLLWRDGVWNRDKIHFTGIMYAVAEDALRYSTLDAQWSEQGLQVFVKDFQKFLTRRFGSIERAWREAFDTDGNGSVNFTEFGLGCKTSGHVGNTTRLWAALDKDRSGEITMDELLWGVEVQDPQGLESATSECERA